MEAVIIHIAVLMVTAFYSYLVYEVGKAHGIDQANFYIFIQTFCEPDWKDMKQIMDTFNDMQEENERTKVSYKTGYRWLEHLIANQCIELVTTPYGHLLFRTLPIKEVKSCK